MGAVGSETVKEINETHVNSNQTFFFVLGILYCDLSCPRIFTINPHVFQNYFMPIFKVQPSPLLSFISYVRIFIKSRYFKLWLFTNAHY